MGHTVNGYAMLPELGLERRGKHRKKMKAKLSTIQGKNVQDVTRCKKMCQL